MLIHKFWTWQNPACRWGLQPRYLRCSLGTGSFDLRKLYHGFGLVAGFFECCAALVQWLGSEHGFIVCSFCRGGVQGLQGWVQQLQGCADGYTQGTGTSASGQPYGPGVALKGGRETLPPSNPRRKKTRRKGRAVTLQCVQARSGR